MRYNNNEDEESALPLHLQLMNARNTSFTDCSVHSISQICLQKDQLLQDLENANNTLLQGDVDTGRMVPGVDGRVWLSDICIDDEAVPTLVYILKSIGLDSIADSISSETLVFTCNTE